MRSLVAGYLRPFIVDSITMFIPQLQSGESWLLANFLGLSGFLERVRFAVDPANCMFYLGPI